MNDYEFQPNLKNRLTIKPKILFIDLASLASTSNVLSKSKAILERIEPNHKERKEIFY